MTSAKEALVVEALSNGGILRVSLKDASDRALLELIRDGIFQPCDDDSHQQSNSDEYILYAINTTILFRKYPPK